MHIRDVVSLVAPTKVWPENSAHELWFRPASNVPMHAYTLQSEARHAQSKATSIVTANCTQHTLNLHITQANDCT